MGCNCNCQSEGKKDSRYLELDEVIKQYKGQAGCLIPVLHKAQGIFGYLPEEVQAYVAEGLDIPLSEVYGVVTFYAFFTTKPRGKYTFNVCLGTACYVKGSGQIMDKLKAELGIEIGETTEDGLFTLEGCRCIGACGLAPVMTVNEDVHGRLVVDDIPKLIKEYKEKVEQEN